jgi:hypothetical protein
MNLQKSSERTPGAEGLRWAVAAALVCALVALCLDLSPLHRFHNSDSLIPIQVALQRWTPYYWEQNRFGMLVPLLALPVSDPFSNLLFQVGLRLLALTASFFLFARAVVLRPWWPAAGALTLATFLIAKGVQAHAFLQMQPYGQSLSLALGGLALVDARRGGVRTVAGLGLLALSLWVSTTTVLWLFPLLWLRDALALVPGSEGERGRGLAFLIRDRRTGWLLGFLFLAFAVNILACRLSIYREATTFAPADLQVWPRAWWTLLKGEAEYLSPWGVWAWAVALAAAVALALRPAERTATRRALAIAACLLGAGLAQLLAVGTTWWAQINSWSLRYVAEGLLAAATLVPAVLLSLLLEGRPARWWRTANALALLAVLPALTVHYGPPSVRTARAAVTELEPEVSRGVAAAHCTHVLGGYWRVWPTVFHAEVLRAERGERGPLWGVTLRSNPIWKALQEGDWNKARVGVIVGGEPAAEDMRRRYWMPELHLAEHHGAIDVYTVGGKGPALARVADRSLDPGPPPRLAHSVTGK